MPYEKRYNDCRYQYFNMKCYMTANVTDTTFLQCRPEHKISCVIYYKIKNIEKMLDYSLVI